MRLPTLTSAILASTSVLILLSWSSTAAGGAIQSKEDFARFTKGYHLEPHPERVTDAIEFVGSAGLFKNPGTIAPTVAFFSEVFARNPEKVGEWKKIIGKQPSSAQPALLRAIALSSSPKRLLDEPPSPRLNDICWGAYYGSGDPVYLERLFAQLAYLEQRGDLSLYMAGASAKLSLASNASEFPTVRAAVERQRARASGHLHGQLDEILTRPPAEIRRDTVEFAREYRLARSFQANAIWTKGAPTVTSLQGLDPAAPVSDLEIAANEDVTLRVSYRAPARDKTGWAKVSYRLSIERPDGALSNPKEDSKEIVAGEGVIGNEHLGHWAASKGTITLRFAESDVRGTHIARVIAKDHVGATEVICVTRLHLR